MVVAATSAYISAGVRQLSILRGRPFISCGTLPTCHNGGPGRSLEGALKGDGWVQDRELFELFGIALGLPAPWRVGPVSFDKDGGGLGGERPGDRQLALGAELLDSSGELLDPATGCGGGHGGHSLLA